MATTPHLGLNLLEQSQAQKEITVNTALLRIDALLNTAAQTYGESVPPSLPAEGEVHIVGNSATGAWSGHDRHIAYFEQVWRFIVPNEGAMLWVADEDKHYVFDGSGWNEVASGGGGGGGGTYTNEEAQDAVGGILADTATIDFTYDDGANSITADVKAASIGTSHLADGGVTYAKVQNVSATDKLLGRVSSGAGGIEEIACTAAGRALLDDADEAAQRVTLGAASLAGNTFTGAQLLPDGSAAAPSLAFANDSDCGFYYFTQNSDARIGFTIAGATAGFFGQTATGGGTSMGTALVSTTSTNYTHGSTAGCGFTDAGILLATRASQPPLNLARTGTDGNIVDIRKAGTAVGSISVTATATAYNTSSDYRLKEDYQPIASPAERLAQLQPRNFAWKATGERADGFIAHEVQVIVPNAVNGEKDGEEMQSIDHSKLVPLLTAALQEALLRIALLEEAAYE